MLLIPSFLLLLGTETFVVGLLLTVILGVLINFLSGVIDKIDKNLFIMCQTCFGSLIGAGPTYREIKSYGNENGDQYAVVEIRIDCPACGYTKKKTKTYKTFQSPKVNSKTGNVIKGSINLSLDYLVEKDLEVFK